MGATMEPGFLLITANLGTLFENLPQMLDLWMNKLYETIERIQPAFIALHCQEVGGKHFRECMNDVGEFVQHLMKSKALADYDRASVYLDEDFSLENQFTALGNIYFVKKSIQNVQCYDFRDCRYRKLTGRNIHQGNLQSIPTIVKEKFSPEFFPEVRWSRKGYMRTRWKLNEQIFDLINIHLFHDASNVQAMQEWPSLYSKHRRKALEHVLKKFNDGNLEKAPLFIFGDFNFRLDAHEVIKTIVSKATPQFTKENGTIKRIVYTEDGEDDKVVLTLEDKVFDPLNKDRFNGEDALWLLEHCKEFASFTKQLFEFERNFPPSYPYSEAIENGTRYMSTRLPAWCDRIFLSPSAKEMLSKDDTKLACYSVIGKDVCMGDHKPVYLNFHISNEPPRTVWTSYALMWNTIEHGYQWLLRLLTGRDYRPL